MTGNVALPGYSVAGGRAPWPRLVPALHTSISTSTGTSSCQPGADKSQSICMYIIFAIPVPVGDAAAAAGLDTYPGHGPLSL